MRIVSLLPSATEIVCSLGLVDQLVGVSHECDYPVEVKRLPSVTCSAISSGLASREIDLLVREQLDSEKALYHLNMELLTELKPDLIVTQALCDVCAVAASEVEQAVCELPGTPQIINLEPMSLWEVFDTIKLVGEVTHNYQKAGQVLNDLNSRVDAVTEKSRLICQELQPRVAFLEWIDPIFNGGHWTPELIHMAGGIDCFGSPNEPSHSFKDEDLIAVQPDLLFIAQCGFKAERTEQDLERLKSIEGWDSMPCVANRSLYYSDGNAYFSRPGPRLVDSLEILSHTLHPEIFPLPNYLNPAIRF